ncbi:MAG: condensation domain-containing protein [Pseudomonas sp.]|uniref:condensation domain-containing protein n=1 Tax=Pseudomonas sp. TaxID=306 RepID=UPI00339751BD
MQPTYLRPLGPLETRMACQHELAGTTQTASLLSLSGPMSIALLDAAAALLWEKHSLLQASIQDDGERLYFAQTAHPVVLRAVALHTPEDKCAALEQELNSPLEAQHGLWKLALLSEPDGHRHHLVLTCHHAIVDAVSLALLLGELLGYCEALLEGQVATPTAEPLPAALEHFLLPPAPPQPSQDLEAPRYDQRAPLAQRQTRLLLLELPAPQLHRLQSRTRALGLSLNDLLGAALLQASSAAGLGQRIRLHTAVSLRQRAERPVPADLLGCFIGVVGNDLTVAGRPLLDLARDYRRQLRESLTLARHANPDVRPAVLRQRGALLTQGSRFAQGIALTNHGLIQMPACRAFSLHDYLNVACRNAGNFAVAVHVTSFADTLNLSFTYVSPLIEPARILTLSQHLQACLLAFSNRQEGLRHEE